MIFCIFLLAFIVLIAGVDRVDSKYHSEYTVALGLVIVGTVYSFLFSVFG